ncbi:MAG TPA: YidC/Oxa1 family membrane protein insertase, partial [Ktedonobacteraceae bacterium]
MNLIADLFNHLFTYPIFNALMFLYHLFGDFGLSIIVLTVAISLVLLPFTLRQLKSARAMIALRTELADIRRQHARDLRAQRQATQELYKQHGITQRSPFVPLLVQLPIFIGLYLALNIVLQHAKLADLNAIIYPFLPRLTGVPNIDLNWFTVFNPAWHISLGLPDPSHILPFLAGLMTFVQMRMSQPNAIAEIQDAMFHVTQIMQFILPLIMVVISIFIAWQLAAGLALYRVTSLLFNMISQSFITGSGSLFTLPRLAGISDGTRSDAETQRQQAQSSS